MLNSSGAHGCPCLGVDHRGKVYSLSPLRMTLAVGFFMNVCYVWKCPSLPSFLSGFIMRANDFLTSTERLFFPCTYILLLEKEMAIHSSILPWEISWTEKPGRLQFPGSQRVRHDLVTKQQQTILLLFLSSVY